MKDNHTIAGSREGNVEVTISAKGQKLIEQAKAGEKVNLLETIKKKYGEDAIVSLNSDSLKEFNEQASKMSNLGDRKELSKQEKESLLQSMIKPAQKLHQIIPNIETNSKLKQSLKNVGEEVYDAAYSIIRENLMVSDAKNMTQEERTGLISLGMEKAQYIADHYMEERDGALFMEAMGNIAKYGMNGVRSEDGRMSYQIKWGPKVGAPDEDSVDSADMMKTFDPDAYRTYQQLSEKKDSMDDMRYLMNWEKNANANHPEWFQSKLKDYTDWKSQMDKTEVGTQFQGTDKADSSHFRDSVLKQNAQSGILNQELLTQNLESFFGYLE